MGCTSCCTKLIGYCMAGGAHQSAQELSERAPLSLRIERDLSLVLRSGRGDVEDLDHNARTGSRRVRSLGEEVPQGVFLPKAGQ